MGDESGRFHQAPTDHMKAKPVIFVPDKGFVGCPADMAKALCWAETDTERRKLGEQMGLDTPVVLAVNDGY